MGNEGDFGVGAGTIVAVLAAMGSAVLLTIVGLGVVIHQWVVYHNREPAMGVLFLTVMGALGCLLFYLLFLRA